MAGRRSCMSANKRLDAPENLRELNNMKTYPLTTLLAAAGFGVLIAPGQTPAQQPYQPAPQYQRPPGYSAPPAYPQQQQPQYSQPVPRTEYVSPMEFLPTFGRKFGDMFRRLFYGDKPPSGYQQGGYPQYGGRSLDQAPGYYQSQPRQYQQAQPQYYQPQYAPPQYQQPQYAQPQTPRYETPPAQQQRPPAQGTPAQTRPAQPQSPPVTSKSKSPASSTKTGAATPAKKYTPPTITRPSESKSAGTPPSTAGAAKTDTPPKTDTASAARTEYFPLPGSQPKDTPKDATASAGKPKSDSPPAANTGAFLKGKRTAKEGRVTSPYPPYQELDVTGLGSGSLALDPTTNKVFEVP